jgi:hypothetical protein
MSSGRLTNELHPVAASEPAMCESNILLNRHVRVRSRRERVTAFRKLTGRKPTFGRNTWGFGEDHTGRNQGLSRLP